MTLAAYAAALATCRTLGSRSATAVLPGAAATPDISATQLQRGDQARAKREEDAS